MTATSNTFGMSTKRVRLIDPRKVRSSRIRFRRDAIPELAYANSLYVPTGAMPARGWILLTKSDYDLVRGYGTAYELEIDQFDGASAALTFGSLAIVQARCVSTGLSEADEGIYLVELTDRRGVVSAPWFAAPINAYYNVLAPAYPGTYYARSLNLGSPWTWDTMIGNVWESMPLLGTYPGLPSVPVGVPQNWNLPGVSAWQAMTRMLTLIGMAVSCDLTLAEPYGIVSMGADDATFNELVLAYADRVEDDLEWIDLGAGRVPGEVVVYFRRVNQYYGTEETVRSDSNQWATNAVYSVTLPAPAFFAGAVGVGHIWDDYCVRQDINGVALPADVVAADAIAQDRVEQYFADIYGGTLGYLNRTYTGVLPFYAGSQVDGVCWRQDLTQRRAGWVTSICRGQMWPEVYRR